MDSLKTLWSFFDKKRKIQSRLLVVLMVFTSIVEVFGIGMVIPFLGALTSPEKVFLHEWSQPFLQIFNISSPDQIILPLTIVFIAASILSGSVRILLLWFSTRLSWSIGADLSVDIYRKTLYQSYEVHSSRNSSSLITGIFNKTNEAVTQAILPVMLILSSTMMLLSVLIVLVIVDPEVALFAFLIFGLIYLLIVFVIRKGLSKNSRIINKEQDKVLKALQEGLGGIRDILIDNLQEVYCRIFQNSDLPLRAARSNNQVIKGMPRFLIETMGMVLIATIALVIVGKSGGVGDAIPLLGTIVLGSQKMLPLLQQIYASWISIQGSKDQVLDVISLLNQPGDSRELDDGKEMSFTKKILIKDIYYKYPSGKNDILKGVDLEILKGQKVGFIGTTGSGKSTLLDVVMGLLFPYNGGVYIDGTLLTSKNYHEWQKYISHVPQNIFLSDSTVYENIAFGTPKEDIDYKRVHSAAKIAEISDSIESWNHEYDTIIGERGMRLSGGQRQRLGIARALYKNTSVLILDEATSALDTKTEKKIMSSVQRYSQDRTILMIAHRVSTLSDCDLIVELEQGKVAKISTRADFFNY